MNAPFDPTASATLPDFRWPDDPTLVPDWIYTDEQIYQREQERIFLGRSWNYVGLDCELPEPGNYIRSFVGSIPVVAARDAAGDVHVFENRCAHRGVEFCRSYRGKTNEFICPYHNWAYDLQGGLIGVPFRRGVKGKGGMPREFDAATRGLRTFRVTRRHGVIFATASPDTEPLDAYLGPEVLREFDIIFDGSELTLLGIHRNTLPGNWKLYQENLKDPYHATLLHTYLTTFGLFVTSNESHILVDPVGRHSALLSRRPAGRPPVAEEDATQIAAFKGTLKLNDPRVIEFVREFDSSWSGSAMTIWPNMTALRQTNILNTRQIVPRGPNELMMIWTVFGRKSDSEEMTRHRLRQNNIFGPGGFLGIEDNEALKFLQDGLRRSLPRDGLAALGDDHESPDIIITERAIRAMYRYYREVMAL